MALDLGATRKVAAAAAAAAAAETPKKPKSMADLLAMLEGAPPGPVEIDTTLLYSPQSSTDLQGSPSGGSVAGAGASPPARGRARWGQGGGAAAGASPGSQSVRGEFSLKAYRPSAGGAGLEEPLALDGFGSSLQLGGGGGAAGLDLHSPGSQLSLDFDAIQQQHRPPLSAGPLRGGGGMQGGLLSPADSEVMRRLAARPASASAAGRAAAAAPRQLKLDDVIAAGVQVGWA